MKLTDTQGELPKDLVGTLYRNGAGRIRVGERLRYGHWFDGACAHTWRAMHKARHKVASTYMSQNKHFHETNSNKQNTTGDGFVSAVTLTGDGRCLFRQRYLAGPKLLAQVKL